MYYKVNQNDEEPVSSFLGGSRQTSEQACPRIEFASEANFSAFTYTQQIVEQSLIRRLTNHKVVYIQ